MNNKSLDFERLVAPVWEYSIEDARHLITLLEQVVDIRQRCRRNLEQPPQVIPPEGLRTRPQPVSKLETHLLQRPPMRLPKPGSLRAAVRDVLLRAARPLPRAEIIERTAALRGCQVDDVLKTKIGDVLTHRHDPCFRKISRGLYAANE
jgi:hypothetical protein